LTEVPDVRFTVLKTEIGHGFGTRTNEAGASFPQLLQAEFLRQQHQVGHIFWTNNKIGAVPDPLNEFTEEHDRDRTLKPASPHGLDVRPISQKFREGFSGKGESGFAGDELDERCEIGPRRSQIEAKT
jgi:hypothetical protein